MWCLSCSTAVLQQPALIKRFMVPYATVARVGRVGAGCSGPARFRKQLPLKPVLSRAELLGSFFVGIVTFSSSVECGRVSRAVPGVKAS